MSATLVKVANRKLKLAAEKDYNVCLIEQDDIIRIKPGRLLLDVLVIKGTAVATQSARSGSEDRLTVFKGERIESGSEIHESNDCYALVEKVIERSLLVELATHVKFNQN